MLFTDALTNINDRFQSGNSVPVERARITISEFESLVSEFRKLHNTILEYQDGIMAIHAKYKGNTP